VLFIIPAKNQKLARICLC